MYKRSLVSFVAGIVLTFTTSALLAQLPTSGTAAAPNNVPPPAGGGKIAFSTNTFEFGRVPAGTVVRATFTVTNTGDAPLEITDVHPGCGCTTAGAWDRKLEPGKTTTLSLQVNTANFGGAITKTVTVTCNDPAQPTTLLFIRGEVWKPVDVLPNMVVFALIADQTNNEVRTVRVVNNTEQDMKIEGLASTHAGFLPTLKEIRPGKEYEIGVTTTPALGGNSAQANITARTTVTNMPTINFTAVATVQPSLQAFPGEVVLPAGPLSSVTQFTVSVRNNSPEPVTLSDPSLNVSNATVNVTPVQPGRFYSLALSFPAGFVLKPGELAQLAFKTSNPKIPLMQVPIRMFPPPPAAVPVAVPH
jgi:hypothetical protein